MTERDYDVRWAFSTKKQSAYGTALVDNSLDKSYPFNAFEVLKEAIEIKTNENQVGVGEFPTAQEQELKDCTLGRKFDAGSMMLAWAAAFGMGAVTSAQQGASTCYKHTITPQTAKQLLCTTIAEQQTSGIKQKIRDICVARFKISASMATGRLQLEMDLVGSGHIATSTLTIPALSADSFLRMSGLTFAVGIAGAEVDVSARLQKWEYEWNNHPLVQHGHYPGSGQYRGRLEFGRRTQKFQFDLLMDSGTTERDHFRNNQALKALVTAVGAAIDETYFHKMVITVPRLKYKELPVSSGDTMMRYSAEANTLYDSGTGYMGQIEVWNTETSYSGTEA